MPDATLYPLDGHAHRVPGSLIPHEDARETHIRLIRYGRDTIDERDGTAEDVRVPPDGETLWVDVRGLQNVEALRQIASTFALHPLAMEDVMNLRHRPKAEEYDDQLFVVTRMVSVDDRIVSEQISLFLGANYVVTFQEWEGDCLDPIRERLRHKRGQIRSCGADYLAYAILDGILDGYFPVLEEYADRLESLEGEIETRPRRSTMQGVQDVKQDLRRLRRSVWPQHELLNVLMRASSDFVSDQTKVYLRDCVDHALRISELVESYREWSSDLVDYFVSNLGVRTNEVMRVLTIIATIFIPLTFVAGIYGMNFDPQASPFNMPELAWRWGYPAVMAFMAGLAISMVWLFRKRGWLGDGRGGREDQ